MSVSSRMTRSGSMDVAAAGLLAVIVALASGCAAPAGEDAASGTDDAAATAVDPVLASVERGRLIVVQHGCGDCHNGFQNPDAEGYLIGATLPIQEFPIQVSPDDPTIYITRARNLTPDNETGMGRFTERQIFNALRYGPRPGETPDVEITSTVPGQGNFPLSPKYLAPPMPWTAFRHLSDQELMDIAAYLKRGLRPVVHQVADSEGPPDFWAGFWAAPMFGTYPLPPFPASQEVAVP